MILRVKIHLGSILQVIILAVCKKGSILVPTMSSKSL
jgi:hypothetical protein